MTMQELQGVRCHDQCYLQLVLVLTVARGVLWMFHKKVLSVVIAKIDGSDEWLSMWDCQLWWRWYVYSCLASPLVQGDLC